eukprot:scaffold129607_cov53-Attheya_sp.AAC.1
MCQTGLIDRIIQALGLEDAECGKVQIPAEYGALAKHPEGESCIETFNYGSVVGMLYTFFPKAPHEKALKRIGRYLKNTRTRGLVLKPSKLLKINCYPDADFVGLWGYEDPQDPNSAKSQTGFAITIADCPIVWHSKMQTEIALSTMEAEYVAFNASCKELTPIIRIVKGLAKLVSLPMNELKPHAVELFKIATENQLGDIYTKGLRLCSRWSVKIQIQTSDIDCTL